MGEDVTLGAAWIRASGSSNELVFASDSRLTGGVTWDRGPKVFALPRSDALISFAGDTGFAYVAIQHIITSIRTYLPSKRRSSDIEAAAGHITRVLTEIALERRDLPKGEDPAPDAEFLFGGWSWRSQSFRLWHVAWESESRSFHHHLVRPLDKRPGVLCWFIGTNEAVLEARILLERMLHDRQKSAAAELDAEPFELIEKSVRSARHRSVGGALQVAKVYQHMNTQQFAVDWAEADGQARLHIGGRRLLSYEVPHVPVFRRP